MSMKAELSLYCKSGVANFTAAALSEFVDALNKAEMHTELADVERIDDLRLDQYGRTRKGYRLTREAFARGSQLLSPGMAKMLSDIAGESVTPKRMEFVSARLAINIWNEMLSLRFPLLLSQRLILNAHNKTIDGFISSRHRYLGNLDLYHGVNDAIENMPALQLSFHAGRLVGRKMAIWLRRGSPAFTVQISGEQRPFYTGYYFTNGEAAGSSVRGTPAVFTPYGVCLAQYGKYGRRVSHTGRRFEDRFRGMLELVLSTELDQATMEQGVINMVTKPLGYLPTWTMKQTRERTKSIVNALVLAGLQKSLALEVVSIGLRGNNADCAVLADIEAPTVYAARRVFDIFVPLFGFARRSYFSYREKIEQVAFSILTGRLEL